MLVFGILVGCLHYNRWCHCKTRKNFFSDLPAPFYTQHFITCHPPLRPYFLACSPPLKSHQTPPPPVKKNEFPLFCTFFLFFSSFNLFIYLSIYLLNLITKIIKIIKLKIKQNQICKSDICIIRTVYTEHKDSL